MGAEEAHLTVTTKSARHAAAEAVPPYRRVHSAKSRPLVPAPASPNSALPLSLSGHGLATRNEDTLGGRQRYVFRAR